MKLVLGKEYYFNLIFKPKKDNQLRLIVFVESRSGRLDSQTGLILPVEELDESVENAIKDINGKKLDDIKGLAYLPHTLEVIVTRLWERIDEALNYKARLAKLKLVYGDTFVEYIGREEDRVREVKAKRKAS